MRAPTDAGAVWFKAVFPPFHHEPAVTRLLAETFGDTVPRVVAIEPDEGWLVTDDLGAASASDGDDAIRGVAARTLVAIQVAMAPRTAELSSLGCPARPIATLPRELARLFDERPRLPGVPDGVDLAELLARVEGAVASVESLGVPASLVHGDFHAGNVADVGGRTVIYDWSDAAIGNPLVDVVTWPGSWLERAAQEAAREAFLAAWSASVDAAALRAASADIVTVGAAYQAVSYAGITRNLEPLRRLELADGITAFLKIAMVGATG
jgi:aminoglycoside phosphotransferase (APT) family kinase protein